jgi:multicomponent Na+:H+ antiporter subunit E
MLLWNIFLAITWAAVTGDVTVVNLLTGFVLGYVVLWVVRRAVGPTSSYFRKVRQVAGFAVFYVWELVLANLRVAYDVVTPTHHMRPGTLAIPLDAASDVEITLLANLITLTPGTLSLDVSADRRVLYIHAMYIDDVERVRRRIKQGYERRVLEVLR